MVNPSSCARPGVRILQPYPCHHIHRLHGTSKQILRLVCAGRAPVPVSVLQRAAALTRRQLMAVLKRLHQTHFLSLLSAPSPLTLSTNLHVRPASPLIFHAVENHLSPRQRQQDSLRMAQAFEQEPSPPVCRLAWYWTRAARKDKALPSLLQSLTQAERAGSLDEVGGICQAILQLNPQNRSVRKLAMRKLARALGHERRRRQAGDLFHQLAREEQDPTRALAFRVQASLQWLCTDQVEKAIEEIEHMSQQVGFPPPQGAWKQQTALFCERMHTLSPSHGPLQPIELVDPRSLVKLEVGWAAVVGWSMIDPCFAYYHMQFFHLARQVGEASWIACAWAIGVHLCSMAGATSWHRTKCMLTTARSVCKVLAPCASKRARKAKARVALFEGICSFYLGQWGRAVQQIQAAEGELAEMRSTAWELRLARVFRLVSFSYLGELAQLCQQVPTLIHEAEAREDLYEATPYHLTHMNAIWLYMNQPRQARQRAQRAIQRWVRRGGYHAHHYYHLVAMAHADLYEGKGKDAHVRVEEGWPALVGSGLMELVQAIRIEATHLRLRAMIAVSCCLRDQEREQICQDAQELIEHLHREKVGWAGALAQLGQAAVHFECEQIEQAKGQLAQAIKGLEEQQMAGYAAAARWQYGRLVSPGQQDERVEQAEAWMRGQGVVHPGRFVGLWAPGFGMQARVGGLFRSDHPAGSLKWRMEYLRAEPS